jgi:Tol biopolymer transport system component
MNCIAASDVRAELGLIVADPRFARSERLASFLRFIVEEELNGRGSQLKEYVIGVEVYRKPVGYDPRLDSTVRVEASKLRQRLAAYYLTEGAQDPVVITVPKGSYQPFFSPRVPDGASVSADPVQRKWLPSGILPTFVRYKPRGAVVAAIGLLAAAIVGLSTAKVWESLAPLPGPPERLTWDGSNSIHPVVSADGRFIVYASDRDSGANGYLNIWRQDLGNSMPRRLTTAAANHTSPALSPDGKEVLFRSDAGAGALFAVSANGGTPVELRGLEQARDLRYSPAGRWVAYWSALDEETQDGGRVYVFDRSDVQPAHPQRIFADFAHATRPVWSRDGKWLLILGTWRSNDPIKEFDAWAVPIRDGLAAGVPVKTGLLPLLRSQGVYTTQLERRAIVAGEWADDMLYVSAHQGNASTLWRVRLPASDPRIHESAEQLNLSGGSESGARVAGGILAYSNREVTYQIFRSLLTSMDGKSAPTFSPVTNEGGLNLRASVSTDGQRIAFESKGASNSDRDRLLYLDIGTAQRHEVGRGIQGSASISPTHALITPEGDAVAFRIGEGKNQAIYMDKVADWSRRKICDDCGAPLSWTGQEPARKILYETGGQPTRIGILDVQTGRYQDWILHPSQSLFGAEPALSGDGTGWVLLYASNGSTTRQILIAPVQSFRVADWRDWIPVTDGARWDVDPTWGPEHGSVYFISHRDGHRCIWRQPLDVRTKRPSGPPAAVHHFHSMKRTLMRSVTNRGAVGLAVANNQLFFGLDERTSAVWVSRFRH